jgi:hypothetical protein
MELSTISLRIFRILKGNGHLIKPYDEAGNEVVDPEQARMFFVDEPNYMVEIDDDEIVVNKSTLTPQDTLAPITDSLRLVADEYQLNYTMKEYGKTIEPKMFSFTTKTQKDKDMNELSESRLGKLHGFRKTSYQRLGEVRLKYTHHKEVKEDVPITRVKNIKSIALEHGEEKHMFPNNFVLGARAMARHLNEGGSYDDEVGQFIIEVSKRCKKMNEFLRYARTNKSLIEGNDDAVALVKENLAQTRYDLKKFIAPTTHSSYYSKFQEAAKSAINTDGDVSDIKDQFTVKKLDDSIEDLFPFINSLLKEKEIYETSILSEIDAGGMFERLPTYNRVLEFDDTMHKLAYKLRETADALKSESLSAFLGRISEKIASQQSLDEFEIKVVREIFNKAQEEAFQLNEES